MPRCRWSVVATVAILGACDASHPLAPLTPVQGTKLVDGDYLAATLVRPRIEESARILFPSILEASGPPMQAFLIADASLQVYRASLTTFNYLGQAGPRPHNAIDAPELKRVLPDFDSDHDAWVVVDPDALRGLVRENVRVIWIHHEPQPH